MDNESGWRLEGNGWKEVWGEAEQESRVSS